MFTCSTLEQLIVCIRKERAQPCDYDDRAGLQPGQVRLMIESDNCISTCAYQLTEASVRMRATIPQSSARDATLEQLSHERAHLRTILVYHAAPALHTCRACKNKQLQPFRCGASNLQCNHVPPGHLGRYKQALPHTLCACMHMQLWVLQGMLKSQ